MSPKTIILATSQEDAAFCEKFAQNELKLSREAFGTVCSPEELRQAADHCEPDRLIVRNLKVFENFLAAIIGSAVFLKVNPDSKITIIEPGFADQAFHEILERVKQGDRSLDGEDES